MKKLDFVLLLLVLTFPLLWFKLKPTPPPKEFVTMIDCKAPVTFVPLPTRPLTVVSSVHLWWHLENKSTIEIDLYCHNKHTGHFESILTDPITLTSDKQKYDIPSVLLMHAPMNGCLAVTCKTSYLGQVPIKLSYTYQ